MPTNKVPANPFYFVLVVLGVVFLITACAYCVMAFRAVKLGDAAVRSSDNGLMTMLHDHGLAIFIVELALLGVATVGAIVLDQRRQNRDSANRDSVEPPHSISN